MSKLWWLPLALAAIVASGCANYPSGGGSGYYESPAPNPNDMRFWSFGQKQAFKHMIEK